MKDYIRILTKIRETPWFITSEGLEVILNIVDKHVTGDITPEQIKLSIGMDDDRNGNELEIINGVGVLPIHGPIFAKANLMTEMSGAVSLETFQRDFRSLMNNSQVHSIVLNVDSPGGTSEMLLEVGQEIFEARDKKPVYAIADNMAGSAALWLATQATSLYSTPSASVGSIGAYLVHQDQSVADAQRGNRFTYISAGKYKTEGNPHEPLSADTKSYIQEIVDECYGEFVSAVARGRGVTNEVVESDYGQGRMMRSKKALDVGLIDGIMTYESLINQLASSRPRSVTVNMAGKQIAATMVGNTLHMENVGGLNMSELTDEHAGQEHADPGEPEREPDQTDKDNDDRVDTPPDQTDIEPDARTQLREVFGLNANAPISEVIAEAKSVMAEVKPLRDAAVDHASRKSFTQQYPEQARELEEARKERSNTKAKAFSESFLNIRNENGQPTNKGFPAVVTNKLEEIHKKFSENNVNIIDFTEVVELIGRNGLVDLDEHGSSRAPENSDDPMHKQYADKVMEIMEADSVDYPTAARLAMERHPDLYEGYRNALPGRRG